MKFIPFVIILILSSLSVCVGQRYLEPMTGCRVDLKNQEYKFLQVNVGAQYTLTTKSKYEFLVGAELSLPFAKKGINEAYTVNPSLPLSTDAVKTIRPYTFTIALGHRFGLIDFKKNNRLFALLYTGFIDEKISVSYAYDKQHYIILNPDKTIENLTIYISAGLAFMHQLPTGGRIFAQVVKGSSPSDGTIKYPGSFGYINPLSFNIGYSIPLTKSGPATH